MSGYDAGGKRLAATHSDTGDGVWTVPLPTQASDLKIVDTGRLLFAGTLAFRRDTGAGVAPYSSTSQERAVFGGDFTDVAANGPLIYTVLRSYPAQSGLVDQLVTVDLRTNAVVRRLPVEHSDLSCFGSIESVGSTVFMVGPATVAGATRSGIIAVDMDTGAVRGWSPRVNDWMPLEHVTDTGGLNAYACDLQVEVDPSGLTAHGQEVLSVDSEPRTGFVSWTADLTPAPVGK